jgi:hypothetical protein
MRNWKELGEVPDSDDETFDSPFDDVSRPYETNHGHIETVDACNGVRNTLQALQASKRPSTPHAESDSGHRVPVSLESSPLSELPDDDDSQEPTWWRNSKPEVADLDDMLIDDSRSFKAAPSVSEEGPSQAFGDLEVLLRHRSRSTPEKPESGASREDVRLDGTLEEAAGLGNEWDHEVADDQLMWETAARSLRPRKPIQQHPYLLESVQYAKAMKSHGVKPLRVAVEREVLGQRREAEEDSQDQEFEDADDTQQPSTEILDQAIDGSQLLSFDDALDDRDILGLSPSPEKTSPLFRSAHTSSQRQDSDQTDNTSLLDDDFPLPDKSAGRLGVTPRDKAKSHRLRNTVSTRKKLKRRVDSTLPSLSARRLDSDIWDLPSISPESRRSQDIRNASHSPLFRPLGSMLDSTTSHHGASPPLKTPRNIIDLTTMSDDGNSAESEADSSSTASNSESEIVKRNSRRIRGVLPASWLRLDQVNAQGESRKRKRSPSRSPKRIQRRGVALSRPSRQNPSPNTFILFHDDDDDSNDNDNNDLPIGSALQDTESRRIGQISIPEMDADDEDPGPLMEDDSFDRMIPAKHRSLASSSRRHSSKRHNAPRKVFKGQPGQRTRQPKITQSFNTSSYTPRESRAVDDDNRSSIRQPSRLVRKKKRTLTPPRLSILDVVEPQAPQFIRIAARTARTRKDLGKASPSRKYIQLGNRRDNIDARTVLHDWKLGKIRPRVVRSRVGTHTTESRPPLGDISDNRVAPLSGSISEHYQLPKPKNPSTESRGVISGNSSLKATHGEQTAKPLEERRRANFRPAQLETTNRNGRLGAAEFVAKKRLLDALYRKNRGYLAPEPPIPSSFSGGRSTQGDDGGQSPAEVNVAADKVSRTQPEQNRKSRFRKKVTPHRIDLGAAQLTHSDDPLPIECQLNDDTETPQAPDTLSGLGPYGLQYSQHFEIFPLDEQVFFHESTLIGRGWLRQISEPEFPSKLRQPRPSASFDKGSMTLRWSTWDETTSSELGILVDWLGDQLLLVKASTDDAKSAVIGAEFILSYFLTSLSFPDAKAERSFVLRTVKVFQGFLDRMNEPVSGDSISRAEIMMHIDTLSRLLLAAFVVYQINKESGTDLGLSLEIEKLLSGLAERSIRMLLSAGLDQLRTLYEDVQQLSARERGIRADQIIPNSWLMIIRVLETASIPRRSFWDVAQSVMTETPISSVADAQKFESLWLDLFTLLPLCQFDNVGVLAAGTRHLTGEGWAMPQQIIKRVFQLYTNNPRQSPSFNEYCRALAARCHYLVHQWRWQKCTGIIGTIFDFFGSQNLRHLRNEEVYASPQFLEELTSSPSLAVEPKDRCFHIFLKTLAIVIQRLKKLGIDKDIRNMIARTLPNHNRQYLKENTVHQHDLSALRNHHDLLCTLFWAAPPDLRPAVHLIEKLVVPGSSHKEACLINLRAWSQLARFVVSASEGSVAFKPFLSWQNNIFQQLLDQYLSAAEDIQQQFLALSKKMPGISNDVVDNMIRKNKAAAMDVLFLSIKASFEVLKLASSLQTATFVLNICKSKSFLLIHLDTLKAYNYVDQLQQVFTRLDHSSRGFDWSIVLATVEMLEYYVSMVERAVEDQYSSDMTSLTDPQDVEEAILVRSVRV